MDNSKTRKLIIIGCIVSFLVVPILTVLILSRLHKPAAEPAPASTVERLAPKSNGDLTAAIVHRIPSLKSGNDPIFVIVNAVTPQKNWYVITIRHKDDPSGNNLAKVLLKDCGGSLGLVALLGPDIQFNPTVMQANAIPDVVATEMNTW